MPETQEPRMHEEGAAGPRDEDGWTARGRREQLGLVQAFGWASEPRLRRDSSAAEAPWNTYANTLCRSTLSLLRKG